ncbi:MAG: cystathionine beta-lyase, partial [Bacteroidia bacterium]|nr:cystathionine beta-lyase [Bacteroidia bacterium]
MKFQLNINTLCVHSGTIQNSGHATAVSPVYPATAYPYLDTEQQHYPRYFNTPNQAA